MRHFYFMVFIALTVGSCAQTKSLVMQKPSEDECLKHIIKKEIDSDAKLSEIPVLVTSVSGGVVNLLIPANNRRPVSDNAVLAVRRGESLKEIQRKDDSVDFLIDFEEKLKRMSAVKKVSWTADEPCTPGFVCQTTGSSERSADENDKDTLCADYRK